MRFQGNNLWLKFQRVLSIQSCTKILWLGWRSEAAYAKEAKERGGNTLQISIKINLINKLKGKHWKQFGSIQGAVMGLHQVDSTQAFMFDWTVIRFEWPVLTPVVTQGSILGPLNSLITIHGHADDPDITSVQFSVRPSSSYWLRHLPV